MAKILDQEQQRKALKNINDSIKEVNTANEFLTASNPSGKYIITFTGDDDKKHTAEIHTTSKDDLDLLVMAHKEREKQRITKLAEENRIALDPEDHDILNFTK